MRYDVSSVVIFTVVIGFGVVSSVLWVLGKLGKTKRLSDNKYLPMFIVPLAMCVAYLFFLSLNIIVEFPNKSMKAYSKHNPSLETDILADYTENLGVITINESFNLS